MNSNSLRWLARRGYVLSTVVAGFVLGPVAFSQKTDRPAVPALRQWAMSDFTDDLSRNDPARSFERGQKLFQDALCAVCHRVGESGGDLGPNLGTPEKPLTRAELLREILEPSKVINPKFQTSLVTTRDGRVIPGIISERTEQSLTVRNRPVGSNAIVTIPTSNVESIETLDISMMPDGLVNSMSKAELLDLLWYVEARGAADSPIYRVR